MTAFALLLAIAFGSSISPAHAAPARASASSSSSSSEADAPETVTIFVDATFGLRKGHMAKQLTKSHAEYAARGYRYVDMAPYSENGDLVGFFVTYTRR
ncbi:MAG TPA: hypothetical protein VFW82_04035 [Dyella sp.]|nr:hypothetical protein [Dyella sp.]